MIVCVFENVQRRWALNVRLAHGYFCPALGMPAGIVLRTPALQEPLPSPYLTGEHQSRGWIMVPSGATATVPQWFQACSATPWRRQGPAGLSPTAWIILRPPRPAPRAGGRLSVPSVQNEEIELFGATHWLLVCHEVTPQPSRNSLAYMCQVGSRGSCTMDAPQVDRPVLARVFAMCGRLPCV